MANPHVDLQALTVRRDSTNGPLLKPPRRIASRVALPSVLLLGFAGMIVWSSWDWFVPGRPVTVTSVVAKTGIVQAAGVELFRASGWVEPRPNPIDVTALAEGVIEELLVLPGQRVEAGEPIAQLISIDAELKLQAAQEDLSERKTKLESAKADLLEAEAQLRGAEATVKATEKLKDKVYGELPYIQAVAERDVAKAKIAQTKSRIDEAAVRVRQGEVAVDIARLRLERMTVRAPVSGIVMNYTTRPGRLVGVHSVGGPHESIVTLYDPESLQVRVRVQTQKFHFVQPGQPVEVEVDMLPGKKLPGIVLYDTHEADIDQDFIYVKVGLVQRSARQFTPLYCLPAPTLVQGALLFATQETFRSLLGDEALLRPEMLVGVRFIAPPTATDETGGEILRIFVPENLLVAEGEESRIWIVDQAAGRAMLRTVVPGNAKQGDLIEITQGLQPSDKLIISGREALQSGQKVRIVGGE